jgi:hypothetical protein
MAEGVGVGGSEVKPSIESAQLRKFILYGKVSSSLVYGNPFTPSGGISRDR